MTNHSSAIKRLRVGLVTLAVLFFVGVAGYTISGMRLLDAIYMVVVTFSTVGNRGIANDNPPLAVFTILMIVFGVSTTLYIVGVFVQMMLEGEINRAIGQRRVTQDIERLSGARDRLWLRTYRRDPCRGIGGEEEAFRRR